MSARPLVSMIIANRNGGRFLREAAQSLLAESLTGLEIIVVDDGSQDDSARAIWDLPVRWLTLGRTRGQSFAQNVGIEEARGKLIGFLDADDRLAPGGLSTRVRFLQANPEKSVVMGSVAGLIDATGKFIGTYESANSHFRPLPSVLTWARYQQGKISVPSQSWLRLYRREALHQVGEFDGGLTCAHDHDHLCRTLKLFPIATLPDPVAFYRLHGRNLSGRFVRRKFKLWPRFIAETFYVNVAHGVRVE